MATIGRTGELTHAPEISQAIDFKSGAREGPEPLQIAPVDPKNK